MFFPLHPSLPISCSLSHLSPFPLPFSLLCSIAPPHFFTPSPLPPSSLISSSLAICLMLYHSGWSCISVVSRSLGLLCLGIEAPYKHLQIMYRSMALIGQAKMKLATWCCACTKQLDKLYLHFSWHCQELAKSLKETNKTKQQGDENSLCSSAMMIGYLVDHNDVSVILLPPWKLLLDNNEYLLSLI